MGEAFRQVHTFRPNPGGQPDVSPDQQDQAVQAGQGDKANAPNLGVRRPKGAEDNPRARWQGPRHARRIGRALRIGEEQQGRQGLPRTVAAL